MDIAMELEAAALAQQQPMLDAMAQGDSEVQTFYKNSVVFVTGGSGFLGKQLIEKLFRCCYIEKLYLLMRAKKETNFQDRIKEILKDPVFDTVHKQQASFSEKIIVIEGDIAKIKLGIKEEDWKILTEEVNVIFHVAATTRFDEPLRSATLINIRGTREALLLGKACKMLRSYVHVSTAYTHATVNAIDGKVYEKFYPSPIPPEVMISMAEDINPERLENITNNFMKGWPNSYTFTKAISEELVRTTSDGLPICIVRPAIVLSTYLEPSPGWLDKSALFGFTGLVLGIGVGVIHTIYIDVSKRMALIPCDYVNNAIIVAAKETASNQTNGGTHTKIYTMSSTPRNSFRLGLYAGALLKTAHTIPPLKAVYYTFTSFTGSQIWFTIQSLLFHIIPAYVADFICLLLGKPRRFAKFSKKLYNVSKTLSFFSLNQWDFIDDNSYELYNGLSKQDQAIFNFDVTSINWKEFACRVVIGLRRYVLKDELKNTEYAIKKQKYMRIGHYIFITLYFYCIWKVICLAYFFGNYLLQIFLTFC